MEQTIRKYLEIADYKNLDKNDENYFVKDLGLQNLKNYLKDEYVKKIQDKYSNGMTEDKMIKKIQSYKREYTKRMNLNAFIYIKAVEYVFSEEKLTSEDFFDWIYSLRLKNEEELELDLAIYFYQDIRLFKLAVDGADTDIIQKERDFIKQKLDELVYSKLRLQNKMDLIKWIMEKKENEIDIIANSGAFNSIIAGYCLLALEEAGIKNDSINFIRFLNENTAADARKKAKGRI